MSAGATTPARPLALVGMMGAGKSTVGPLLAAARGARFVDLDDAVAATGGAPAATLLAREGEAAFRQRERAALAAVLAEATPTVLATGGGTLTDGPARRMLLAGTTSVALWAEPATLWARLGRAGAATRPLLGDDPAAALAALARARAPLYRAADLGVVTDGLTPAAVAQAVTAAVAAHVPGHFGLALARASSGAGDAPHGGTSVAIRADAGEWLAAAVRAACPGPRLVLLSDTHVGARHVTPLAEALRAGGHAVTVLTVAAGEGAKSLTVAAQLYEALADAGLDRHDALVAVGGGVVGDLGGFVAATFLRGIGLVQVPTSTLAAVDASVGGKTAVNLPRGKNLVGTFYPARASLTALDLLRTQDAAHHAAGLAEALKMAATCDAALFEDLVAEAEDLLAFGPRLPRALYRALRIKAAVVEADPRDLGGRAVLNFGHTLGHALERGMGYREPHGVAVARGMVGEAELACALGLCPPDTVAALCAGLSALNLPTSWRHVTLDAEAMGQDKKREGDAIWLPMLIRLGAWAPHLLPRGTLAAFCATGRLP